MFEKKALNRITAYIAAASVGLTVLTLMLGGAWMALGAAVGGAFAIGNWIMMRWVGKRLLVANDVGRALLGLLLAVKMAVVLGAIWLVLSTQWVDPIGFAVGLSGLVLGVLAGAYHAAASAGRTAEKED